MLNQNAFHPKGDFMPLQARWEGKEGEGSKDDQISKGMGRKFSALPLMHQR
jgi:hypothetical protein